MPINVQTNIFLRNQVRRTLVLPTSPPLPLYTEPIPDTSPEKLAMLRAAGVVKQPRTEQQDAVADQARKRAADQLTQPLALPVSFGFFVAYAGGASFDGDVSSGIPFDFTIKQVHIVIVDTGLVGSTDEVAYQIAISPSDTQNLTNMRGAQHIVQSRGTNLNGIPAGRLLAQGTNAITYLFDINSQLFPAGYFIHFIREPLTTQILAAQLTVQNAFSLEAPGAIFASPPGRISINLNTQPTQSRSPAPTVPRGAKILVTQGGRILSERIIGWAPLDPGLKSIYFNELAGAPKDPNIEWIR